MLGLARQVQSISNVQPSVTGSVFAQEGHPEPDASYR